MNQPFVLSLYRLPAGKALLCADLVECRRDVSIGIGTMMSMSIDIRRGFSSSSMVAVPPLKQKSSPETASPSRSIKARITFSTRILSALL